MIDTAWLARTQEGARRFRIKILCSKTKKARATLARDYVLLDDEQQVILREGVFRGFAAAISVLLP